MICLKQNTKWGWPHKTICIVSDHLSITSLVRSVALMSASRPSLPLGTQGYLPQSAKTSLTVTVQCAGELLCFSWY